MVQRPLEGKKPCIREDGIWRFGHWSTVVALVTNPFRCAHTIVIYNCCRKDDYPYSRTTEDENTHGQQPVHLFSILGPREDKDSGDRSRGYKIT